MWLLHSNSDRKRRNDIELLKGFQGYQLSLTCSNSAIETPEQCVKSIQIKQ